jgi:hypothetical protein
MPTPMAILLQGYVDTGVKIGIMFRAGPQYSGVLAPCAVDGVFKLLASVRVVEDADPVELRTMPPRRDVEFYFEADAVSHVSPIPRDLAERKRPAEEKPTGLTAEDLAQLGITP